MFVEWMSMLLSWLSTDVPWGIPNSPPPVKNIPSTQARMSTVLDTPLVHGFATAIILKNGVSMQWCAIIVYKVSDKRIIMNNSKPI